MTRLTAFFEDRAPVRLLQNSETLAALEGEIYVGKKDDRSLA